MLAKLLKEEVGRQHQGMDRPGVRHVPEGSGEQGKMEKTGSKIICGAPTTLAVKGLLMLMLMSMKPNITGLASLDNCRASVSDPFNVTHDSSSKLDI